MKLTKRSIDTFKYEGDGTSRDVRWDDVLPGFGVRIYPSGRKAFVLSYRTETGKKRLVTLGTYGRDLTLDQARDKVTKERGKIIDGGDPVKVRRQERERQRIGERFGDVAENFLTLYVEKELRRSTIDLYSSIVRHHLIPRWKSKLIEEIDGDDAAALFNTLKDQGMGVGANRVFAVTRKLFGWCVSRRLIKGSPMDGLEPPVREVKRDRALSDDELRLVWDAADSMNWPFGPFTKLLILTAQRRGEVAAMKWADLDLDSDGPAWTLPREATKADRAHVVPLSPQAVEIIEALPRMEGQYVFNTGRDTPISGFSKAKARIDRLIADTAEDTGISVPDTWRMHDIRRTAASGMARLNVPPHILSRVLNHAPGQAEGVTAIYNRHSYMPELRHALNAWAAHVERIVSGDATGNVVELASAAE